MERIICVIRGQTKSEICLLGSLSRRSGGGSRGDLLSEGSGAQQKGKHGIITFRMENTVRKFYILTRNGATAFPFPRGCCVPNKARDHVVSYIFQYTKEEGEGSSYVFCFVLKETSSGDDPLCPGCQRARRKVSVKGAHARRHSGSYSKQTQIFLLFKSRHCYSFVV